MSWKYQCERQGNNDDISHEWIATNLKKKMKNLPNLFKLQFYDAVNRVINENYQKWNYFELMQHMSFILVKNDEFSPQM